MSTTFIVVCIIALVWKYKADEKKAHDALRRDLESRGMW